MWKNLCWNLLCKTDGRPIPKKTKEASKEELIRKDIEQELEKLAGLKENAFFISSESEEVKRYSESEIAALESRGQKQDANRIISDLQLHHENVSNHFSKQNYKQYKEILRVLEDEAYEPAFKYLMLNETLTKVYKREKNNGKEITIVENRDLEKSISGHMVLKKFTLEYIYRGINEGNAKSFKDLYNDAISEYQTVISQESEINLEDVNTYNKGKWLKFKGVQSDPDNYLSNASKLSALVQGTPWCTKTLAGSQLNEGDFFVFVDNNEKPHIAVKMLGNTIDEVRGIQNGNAQELEDEYRDVAISFLENNKDIENGIQWLEKEEWNKRLIEYGHRMQCHEFGVESVESLLNDLFFREDYNNHSFCKNSNLTKLKNQLYLAKPIFAQYFGMKEEEVYCGNCFSSNMNNVRIVLGDFNGKFDGSKIQTIYGDAYFDDTTSLENLESIYGGNATFQSCVIPEIQGINMKYLVLYNSYIDKIDQCIIHSDRKSVV